MIAAVAHSRRFRDRRGRKLGIPALRRRESFFLLVCIGLGFGVAETLLEFLINSRSVELKAFGPIALAPLILLAGYRSAPPDRPCFVPGGCTVASVAPASNVALRAASIVDGMSKYLLSTKTGACLESFVTRSEP